MNVLNNGNVQGNFPVFAAVPPLPTSDEGIPAAPLPPAQEQLVQEYQAALTLGAAVAVARELPQTRHDLRSRTVALAPGGPLRLIGMRSREKHSAIGVPYASIALIVRRQWLAAVAEIGGFELQYEGQAQNGSAATMQSTLLYWDKPGKHVSDEERQNFRSGVRMFVFEIAPHGLHLEAHQIEAIQCWYPLLISLVRRLGFKMDIEQQARSGELPGGLDIRPDFLLLVALPGPGGHKLMFGTMEAKVDFPVESLKAAARRGDKCSAADVWSGVELGNRNRREMKDITQLIVNGVNTRTRYSVGLDARGWIRLLRKQGNQVSVSVEGKARMLDQDDVPAWSSSIFALAVDIVWYLRTLRDLDPDSPNPAVTWHPTQTAAAWPVQNPIVLPRGRSADSSSDAHEGGQAEAKSARCQPRH